MTYISGGTLKGVVRMKPPTASPGLSVANEGRIYYDSVSNQFKSSENGGPYVTLGAPALIQTVMPQWPSLTNGPVAQTASLGMLGFAGSMDIRDGFAYVGDYANPTGRILVIDVSAPDRPILVGTVSSASLADPTTIVASGSYLMVARLGGVSIVDVTSPASPTVVGTLALSGGQDHYGILVGSIFWVWETTTARLNAVDVSDPTNPVIVGQLSPAGGQTCLANAFARDTLYSVTWSNFLLCIDVSNPAAPTLLGSVSTGGGSQPSAIAVDGRTAYVVCYGGASLQCYDISNPASPTLLGSVATGWGGGGAISLLGDGLVLISGGGGALVVDATDPTAPVVTVPLFTTRVYPAMYPRGRWLHGVYYTGSTYAFGTWDTSSAQLVSPELGCARANTLEVRDRLDANLLIVDRLEIGKGGVVDWSRTGGTGGRWSVLDKQRGGTPPGRSCAPRTNSSWRAGAPATPAAPSRAPCSGRSSRASSLLLLRPIAFACGSSWTPRPRCPTSARSKATPCPRKS